MTQVSESVRFESPDLTGLAKQGLACVDMHLHTDHSDASVNVPALLGKARREGLGLSVTDHNVISGSMRAFAERGQAMVVPGIEVSAADGPHILAYFYEMSDLEHFHAHHVKPHRRPSPWLAIRSGTREIVDALAGYSCLTVAAHPYGYLVFNKGLQKCIDYQYLPSDILEGFEGFEVLCGGMARALNRKAVDLAGRTGKCFTGGTDGHTLDDIGTVVTCAPASTHQEFLAQVEAKANLVIGREKNPFRKLATGTVLLSKHSRYLVPSMQVHWEQNSPRLGHYFRRHLREWQRPRK